MIDRMRVSAMLCCFLAVCTLTVSAPALARTLYVSAQGSQTGNGSRSAPFHTLAAVERASNPGDVIIVLSTPVEVPPLDGGIKLKDHQKLIGEGPGVALAKAPLTVAARITNSTEANNGDAVVMADNASVSNLVILNARRSGVYMNDVTDVTVAGNAISASNTSCIPGQGYEGPLFSGRPMHGYAAVMADYSSRAARFR